MKLEDVEKLILLMQKHELSELQLKEADWEFSARRGDKNPGPTHVVYQTPAAISQQMPAVPAAGSGQAAPAVPAPANEKLKEIPAPIVGTFYRAPAPDQAPFKEVGDRVSPDEVVCIVEAMKVMNEIKAGVAGTIKKILVENASAVEFGQPLFLVEVG
jgi:acetyl-CoA carboxylase biotin carboxyl carrier protein